MKENIVLLMFSCLSLTACDGFLDLKPKDALVPNNFYNNGAEVDKALNGVYQVLALKGGANFILNSECMTDNCVYSSASGSEWLDFSKGTLNPSTTFIETCWMNNYKGIARANLVIQNLQHKQTMVITESTRLRFLGEARFLRAFFYADLLENFGAVPIILEPKENISEYNLPRSSAEEVLAVILADLKFAVDKLEPKPPINNKGRATKGAALFLKARTLLCNYRYADANTALNELNDLKEYEMEFVYDRVFASDNENNKEIIFDIQYADATKESTSYIFYDYIKVWSGGYVPTVSLAEEFYDLRGMKVSSTTTFGNFFKNRDKRMAVTLTRPQDNWGDKIYAPKATDKKNYNSCMKVRKYLVFSDVSNTGKRSVLNIILFRYADVKLMQAECIIEDNNLFAVDRRKAITLIDDIRSRAGLPAIERVISTPTRDDLRDILRRERRCEFAFENSRLRDLRRWRIAQDAISGMAYGYDPESYESASYVPYVIESNRLFKEHNYLWPIPQSEMDANTSITKNNPGY